MKLFLKIISSFILILTVVTAFGYYYWYKPKFHHLSNPVISLKRPNINAEIKQRLIEKVGMYKKFSDLVNYNKDYCFFIDMKIASGKKRFFVYNLIKDSVEVAGLVTHGSGSANGNGGLIFSNIRSSGCTSLGRYRIGSSYLGKFGLAYKLYGLDKTNSKAIERFVVLHAHNCVPDDEVNPLPICESQGCPTVSPAFLIDLKKYINEAKKPVMLWIYY